MHILPLQPLVKMRFSENVIASITSFYVQIFIVLPHITPFDLEEEVNTGESIQLNCHVSKGDRPLKISWNFYGEALSSHMGISTTKLGDRSSVLTIASAMAAHSGNYTCTATNAAGSTSYTATVHINGIGSLPLHCCLWDIV